MWRITSDLLRSFFARHLDGVDSTAVDQVTADYPEIVLGPP
jgi:hypothetical protein